MPEAEAGMGPSWGSGKKEETVSSFFTFFATGLLNGMGHSAKLKRRLGRRSKLLWRRCTKSMEEGWWLMLLTVTLQISLLLAGRFFD